MFSEMANIKIEGKDKQRLPCGLRFYPVTLSRPHMLLSLSFRVGTRDTFTFLMGPLGRLYKSQETRIRGKALTCDKLSSSSVFSRASPGIWQALPPPLLTVLNPSCACLWQLCPSWAGGAAQRPWVANRGRQSCQNCLELLIPPSGFLAGCFDKLNLF